MAKSQGLFEILLFLMLDSGDRYLSIRQVPEPSNVATTSKINDRYRTKPFGREANFLERLTND
jgi:hypothetical protein